MSEVYASELDKSIVFTIGEKILVRMNPKTYSLDPNGEKMVVVITGWYRNYYIGEIRGAFGEYFKVTIHKTDLLSNEHKIRRLK